MISKIIYQNLHACGVELALSLWLHGQMKGLHRMQTKSAISKVHFPGLYKLGNLWLGRKNIQINNVVLNVVAFPHHRHAMLYVVLCRLLPVFNTLLSESNS